MPKITLYGFDGSTYVRTVKMLLAEKGCTDFEQVMVNVLEGEPKQPEHLERHPFGKVPVLDWDGVRILETPPRSWPGRPAGTGTTNCPELRWCRRPRRTGRGWTCRSA